MNYTIINGFKCYAPEMAHNNHDYPADIFRRLYLAESSNFWFRTRNKVLIHIVGKYLGKTTGEKKFLEVGCGTGYVLRGLNEYLPSIKLTGAEIHVEGLKYASERVPLAEFIQLDATNMQLGENFNGIGAFDVLEHIEEDENVMKNIYQSLQKAGFFFISVPQYNWMWSEADDVAFHKRRYTRKELKRKLGNAGFETVYMGSFLFTLFPFMMLSRFMKKKKKTAINSEDAILAELELPPFVNSVFYYCTLIDVLLIRAGVRLPWGGSIICVAVK